MIAKILAPLAGILLLAGYACATTVSVAQLQTMVPSPAGKYFKLETENLFLKPVATEPSPCPEGTVYYDIVKREFLGCDQTGTGISLGPWIRESGTTKLRDPTDKILNGGTYIGQNNGVSLSGTFAVTAVGAGNTNAATYLGIVGRGNRGIFYNPAINSFRGGRNVMIGGIAANNPDSNIWGAEITLDPTASFLSILGGSNHTATGTISHAVIGGGDRNAVGANLSSVVGGDFNTITGTHSFVGGGHLNQILNPATHSMIGGGEENTINVNTHSVIVGGYQNATSPIYSFIGGGWHNRILGAVSADGGAASTIAGGRDNTISADYAAIAGGRGNTISGDYSFTAGNTNTISGPASAAIGANNTIGNVSNSFVFGSGGNAQTSNTAVFSNVSVAIGRNDARAALDVNNGQIVLGGNLYAAGSSLPLVIRGAVVAADGSINSNYGISSVTHTGEGTYEITFPIYTDLPLVQAIAINDQPLTVKVTNLSLGSLEIGIFDHSGAKYTDSDFSIEVKGSKLLAQLL